jgi:hypothetical protein
MVLRTRGGGVPWRPAHARLLARDTLAPAESRGAAFGCLAPGVQIRTAASLLVTGALDPSALPPISRTVASRGVAAAVLLFGARDLIERGEAAL